MRFYLCGFRFRADSDTRPDPVCDAPPLATTDAHSLVEVNADGRLSSCVRRARISPCDSPFCVWRTCCCVLISTSSVRMPSMTLLCCVMVSVKVSVKVSTSRVEPSILLSLVSFGSQLVVYNP